MKKVSLLFAMLFCAIVVSAQSVEMKRSWLDDYGYENDAYGRYAHTGFIIYDCKDKQCSFYVYMFDIDKNLLKDSQGRNIFYRSYFTPSTNSAKFHDYRIFCKKAYQHPRAYYYQIRIKDYNGNTIGKSSLLKL